MINSGNILVIEDQENWRSRIRRVLERAGYAVTAVGSREEALQTLREHLYHLAIVDLSLESGDAQDEQGMHILQDMQDMGLSEAVTTIILSGHGTTERMRTAFRDYGVVDFLSKREFDADELLTTVRKAWSDKVQVSLDLQILPRELDFEALVANLQIEGQRIRRRSDSAHRIASELRELFRRLFFRCASIVVTPLSRGYSGAGVISVRPVYADSGVGACLVVKFGDRVQITREYANFKKYVEAFIGHGRTTGLIEVRYTPRLGGILYTFLGTDVEQLASFETFYRQHDVAEIEAVIDDLFNVTCARWYANRSAIAPMDLVAEYLAMFEVDSLEALGNGVFIGSLKRYRQRRRLDIPGVPVDNLPNPIDALSDQSLIFVTSRSVTHGDLSAENILIDASGRTWLIDFYRTGPGHILRDCVELEAVVKLLLLDVDDMGSRYELEHALAKMSTFDQVQHMPDKLDGAVADVQKAYAVVRKIRRIARQLAQTYNAVDFSEYQVGLVLHSLNVARFLSLPVEQRVHALMAASLGAQALGIT
jgi:ActR/RegA family two-component response regulator